jgi:cytochrome b
MGGPTGRRATIWDLPTRLFHWLLVLLIAGAWVTQEEEAYDLHAPIGYAVLALLLFRIGWGFVGSETSRFSTFVKGPGKALQYLRGLRGSAARVQHVGHNPLGGYSVLLMLLALFVQAVTGLFLYDGDFFWGPLNHLVSEETADLLEEVHEINFNLLLVLILFHLLAIIYYRFGRGQDLLRPMVGGKAELPDGVSPPRIASGWLALVLLLGSAALVYLLITAA